MQFCKDNNTAIFHDDDQSALIELLKDLGSQLKEEFKDKFKVRPFQLKYLYLHSNNHISHP
jgi:hypothetical protein